jgi:predicted transcriptional regulator
MDPELKARLERLAKATHRSRSYLASEAIRRFVELEEWQVQGIGEALVQADRGEGVEHEQVDAWLASWGSDPESEPPC